MVGINVKTAYLDNINDNRLRPLGDGVCCCDSMLGRSPFHNFAMPDARLLRSRHCSNFLEVVIIVTTKMTTY